VAPRPWPVGSALSAYLGVRDHVNRHSGPMRTDGVAATGRAERCQEMWPVRPDAAVTPAAGGPRSPDHRTDPAAPPAMPPAGGAWLLARDARSPHGLRRWTAALTQPHAGVLIDLVAPGPEPGGRPVRPKNALLLSLARVAPRPLPTKSREIQGRAEALACQRPAPSIPNGPRSLGGPWPSGERKRPRVAAALGLLPGHASELLADRAPARIFPLVLGRPAVGLGYAWATAEARPAYRVEELLGRLLPAAAAT